MTCRKIACLALPLLGMLWSVPLVIAQRGQPLPKPRFFRQVFRKNHFSWWLNVNFFEKEPRGNHCFQFALLRAGCQRFVGRRVVEIDRNFSAKNRRLRS